MCFSSLKFDPSVNNTDETPMECQNKGLWHTGLSDEACETAGGKWIRTPCVTLKETIDQRPARFALDNPIVGNCQDNFQGDLIRLDTAFVSADMNKLSKATRDGCHEFCKSLPQYSIQTGMMTQTGAAGAADEITDCQCIYPSGKLPSRESMPLHSKPSPPKFALTNSDGMALGLRPKIACDAAADLMIETQVADLNNPRQQFQITPDGQIVSVPCPEKVLTAVLGGNGTSCTGGSLQIENYGYSPNHLPSSVNAPDLQRWMFNSQVITNAGCPNLAVSSSKAKDVSLNSIYFALQNPRTQLAMGFSASAASCTDGMTLEMQDLAYGSPNQQFIYIENDQTIVSVKCPQFAITIPSGDCGSTVGLHLSSQNHSDGRNKWTFDTNGNIQSVLCSDKYITIQGASSGRAKLVTMHSSGKTLLENPFGKAPKQEDATNSPTAAFTEKTPKNSNSYSSSEWDPTKPPSVGSSILLSELNSERYQKWEKMHQVC